MSQYVQYIKVFVYGVVLCFWSCSDQKEVTHPEQKERTTLFTKMNPEQTGIDFTNTVSNQKDFNIFKYRNFYNGGGVGLGDINNDGLIDVYLTSNMEGNKLYLNQGDFKFKDISASSGAQGKRSWSTGVVMVDINADGLLDIYVCNAGNVKGDDQKNELFINNGDLTFTEQAEKYNLADSGFTTHAAFFDYDQDGDLDAYMLNNSFIPVSSLGYDDRRNLRSKDWNLPEMFKGGGDKLLRNDEGKYVDVSEEAGIYGSLIGFGLGVTVGDINQDTRPDIYVSNDFYERDYLYINNGDGTFTEDIKNRMPHLSLASMGADMADLNNDGYPEIFVTDMLPEGDERLKNTSSFERYDVYALKQKKDFYHQYMQNTLQFNNTDGTFSEIACYSGVSGTDWSWGALLFDMDNDGYRDIYVCNGIVHDLTNQDFINFFANEVYQKMALSGVKTAQDSIIGAMPSTPVVNYAYRNQQNLTFENKTQDFGFDEPTFSNGAAYGDLDNDGDLDLIVNNTNMPTFVYQNQSKNAYLKINLKGEDSNTFAIGSVVELYYENQVARQELMPTRGFQSSMAYDLNFGLGSTTQIDSIKIQWPNGKVQQWKDIPANQTLSVSITDSLLQQGKWKNEALSDSYFEAQSLAVRPHKEDEHIDFNYEGLIYKMLSKEGPAMALGDINGDGNPEVYLGGARGQAGAVYRLNEKQRRSTLLDSQMIANPIFETDKNFEDTDAIFIDVDGDTDLDLMVGSGGNIPDASAKSYAVRVYINDGKGMFSKGQEVFNESNTAVLAAYDYDGDQDLDVFVGNISVPGIYGITPKHLLLQNDGTGQFENVIATKAFKVQEVGMISDALWEDMDGDDRKDLIVVGEWMAPHIFKNNGKRLGTFKTNLEQFSGWHHTVTASDLDQDGDLDLVLGNRGLNAIWQADAEHPAKMFVNDFDKNGTIEQIFTRTINGKDLPMAMKGELTQQLTMVKKKNLKFSEYASKSVYELFEEATLQNAIVKEATSFESVIAYNTGNGNFEIKALPQRAQWSSIRAIATEDLNNDGVLDLILGGNHDVFKPQYGRLDASRGLVLLSTDKTTYTTASATGFTVNGVVNGLYPLAFKNGSRYMVASVNNGTPVAFKVVKKK